MSFKTIAVIELMIVLVMGNGTLYVGLHGFSNPTNTTFNGSCCGIKNSVLCASDCRLLFVVTVTGFGKPETKSLVDTPIFGSRVISIPVSTEMRNPLSFSFKTWPGRVDIAVRIYNENKEYINLVDEFKFPFEAETPRINYINTTQFGMRPVNKTILRMILRYDCDFYFEGNDCSRFCPPDRAPCTSLHSTTTESITDWTLLLTTDTPKSVTRCPTINSVGGSVKTLDRNESTENCTDEIDENSTPNAPLESTTQESKTSKIIPDVTSEESTIPTVEPDTKTVLTTELDSVSVTTMWQTSTKTVESNSITSLRTVELSSTTTTVPTTSTSHSGHRTTQEVETVKPSTKIITKSSPKMKHTTTPTVISLKSKPPTNRIGGVFTTPLIVSASEKSTLDLAEISTHLTSSRIPDGGKTINEDVMQYWPAIVGGVLGVIAVIAVLGVFIYVRKLRAQQKETEDIYNVNPQTWILETNENGTSGMSEIALETEMV